MPDLLLELFSEEIPARMQRRAAADLQKLVTDALVEAGLLYEGAKAFATPRRLALTVHGLPARSPDQKEEKKGPRVGAPEQAIAGFLKSAGLASIDQAKIQEDKKGNFYVAVVQKPGRAAPNVIAEIVPKVVRDFPWPKSMRWGSARTDQIVTEAGDHIVTESGDNVVVTTWLRWVRPLHSILCVFGPETEATAVVDFEVGGIRSGNVTYGHRFMAPGPIEVRRFDDYVTKLEKAKVVLDGDRRKQIILADAQNRAMAAGLELLEDDALAEEVAGLVEWPVVLMGSFDEAFLEIPPEVIRATIRNNQKCFVLKSAGRSGALHPPLEGESRREAPGWGGATQLSNRFLLVANIEASDGGKEIVAGNERVIRARLSDARYFWETDLKTKLEDRLPKLDKIVFHEKLGTQGERVQRIMALAHRTAEIVSDVKVPPTGVDVRPGREAGIAEYAGAVGAFFNDVQLAAHLCKADLVTEMVGEFPELQGLIGKYYALKQGEDASVATAIEDHYKPVGPNARVPIEPVTIAVALADKIDLLQSFWSIEEKPTGSKDPFALRRAALGVIRLVLENQLRAKLVSIFDFHAERLDETKRRMAHEKGKKEGGTYVVAIGHATVNWGGRQVRSSSVDLLAFFADRLKVQLREQGARHDLVDAVFALGNQDDLLLIVRRVEALGKFLDTDDGGNLLAGTKRAANILRDEEKKSAEPFTGPVEPSLLTESEEKALASALDAAVPAATAAVTKEDFAAAMTALAKLRAPVDAFFDKVRVNADDPKVRANRLRLLNRLRHATLSVADFSKIAGLALESTDRK